ncbi:MAG TPA: DUF2306 domain-containing protein [Cyclobacteriaceae bacterium]|nr:DUF2306 domain-containing protein [Cyclobacteriaceae bacterium]
MKNLIHDMTGLIHVGSAVIAMVLGTWILIIQKGTRFHKRMGYAYAVSMLIVNGSAFNSYHLFGTFGPFHFTALISLVTLALGMVPVIRRKPENWLGRHMSWMYFSVVGLYAAFFSEVLVRVPGTPFAPTVSSASVLTVAAGMWVFFRKRKMWMSRYSLKSRR